METLELERIERRLRWVERFENPTSIACGLVLAIPYVIWWFQHGRIAAYSWIFPFLIAAVPARICFAFWGGSLENRKRAITNPEEFRQLPEARVVSETASRSEPELVTPIESHAPEAVEPAGEKPRFLG